MYEIAELRDMLTRYKDQLGHIVARYDQLCDICLEDGLTYDTEDEMDFLDEKMKTLDDAIDAINELLDEYNFR